MKNYIPNQTSFPQPPSLSHLATMLHIHLAMAIKSSQLINNAISNMNLFESLISYSSLARCLALVKSVLQEKEQSAFVAICFCIFLTALVLPFKFAFCCVTMHAYQFDQPTLSTFIICCTILIVNS